MEGRAVQKQANGKTVMATAIGLAKTVCDGCRDDRAMLFDVIALCANAYFIPPDDVDKQRLTRDAFMLREWIRELVQPEARH
jgi:hypothetical protein